MYGRFTLYTNVPPNEEWPKVVGPHRGFNYPVILRTYSFLTRHDPRIPDPTKKHTISRWAAVVLSLCWSGAAGESFSSLPAGTVCPSARSMSFEMGFLQPEKMGAKTSHRGCPMVNIPFDQCLIYLPLYIYIYYINGWFCVVKCG